MTAAYAGGGSVVFVDPLCPRPYTPSTLAAARLGGTEATLLKVAAALARDCPVRICQKSRQEKASEGGIDYLPLAEASGTAVDARAVIVINSWKVALSLRKVWPETPISVWLHVIPGRHNRKMGHLLAEADVGLVCVSQTQARSLRETFTAFGGAVPEISVIFNPIDDDLRPNETERDPNLLLFASAPHKGLGEVLELFELVQARLPDLRLEVADPGYLAWRSGRWPRTSFFGRCGARSVFFIRKRVSPKHLDSLSRRQMRSARRPFCIPVWAPTTRLPRAKVRRWIARIPS
ncbi:glycosyltransferase family 4 protein [Rhodobacterales bacterium]|nr:glycosyltransferase family 4 protein [Rhodobacterales bacterium]